MSKQQPSIGPTSRDCWDETYIDDIPQTSDSVHIAWG